MDIHKVLAVYEWGFRFFIRKLTNESGCKVMGNNQP